MTDKMQLTESNNYLCTRRLLCNIRGSLKQFDASGAAAATWTPTTGKVNEIFGLSHLLSTGADQSDTLNALQNAILHKVTLLEVKNEFPLTLGISVNCCPNDEVTRTGEKFAFTALPESHNPTPHKLFEADIVNNEGMLWRNTYPQYNSNNLETHGVLHVNGENYVFVSKDHPVVDMLKKNAAILNADITQQPLIDGEWYKVSKQVMSGCVNQLKERVLTKIHTRNLADFQLQIHRPDGEEWTTFTHNDEIMSAVPRKIRLAGDPSLVTNAVSDLINTPKSVVVRLELVYEINVNNSHLHS